MGWAGLGAGTIAAEHGRGAGRDVATVQTASARRDEAFPRLHGIAGSATVLLAIRSPDRIGAVDIPSTDQRHHAQALAEIGAVKHVLHEKPLVMAVAQAARIVQAARTRTATEALGLILIICHHLRCSDSHRARRDLVVPGRIGRVLSPCRFPAVHPRASLCGWRTGDAAAGGGVAASAVVRVVREAAKSGPRRMVQSGAAA